MDYTVEIRSHTLEYIDEGHIYVVDGIAVPSITQLINKRLNKYEHIAPAVLNRAAEHGIYVHDAIQKLCEDGEVTDIPEVHNFIFLQRQYGFKVLGNEIPVILWHDDDPVAAGRLDLVLEMDGQIGGADIKSTATLDRLYLAYQLNSYRLAYEQSYGITWQFLRGIHLKDHRRKFVEIPIDEACVWEQYDAWRLI